MSKNIIDYLFSEIIDDIKYASTHRIKINGLENESKLKINLIKSVQKSISTFFF